MIFVEKPLLSIIVPIHNMAGKLQNLELSLKASKELNLPVSFILVHDGLDEVTNKEVSDLAASYKAKYLNLVVNSPGLARNYGLQHADSEWVAFWDSDDIGSVKEAISSIHNSPLNAEFILAGYSQMSQRTKIVNQVSTPIGNFPMAMINPGIWRFIFRRSAIVNTNFPPYRMGEDQVFLARLLINESSVYFSDKNVYLYVDGEGGQLTKDKKAVSEILLAIDEITQIITHNSWQYSYLRVMRTRMITTALKHKLIPLYKALILFSGSSSVPVKKRCELTLGSLWPIFLILSGKLK